MPVFTKTFENSEGRWWAEFRNGLTDKITGIELWQPEAEIVNEGVYIDILSSRGKNLRGGARVPASALIELCIDFLHANSYEVFHETEPDNLFLVQSALIAWGEEIAYQIDRGVHDTEALEQWEAEDKQCERALEVINKILYQED